MTKVNGIADVLVTNVIVVDDTKAINDAQPPKGKPFLKFEDGTEVLMTTNLAEMIGGVGAGARLRYEDKHKK